MSKELLQDISYQEAPLLDEVMGEISAAKCQADLSKAAAKVSYKGAP